MRQAGIGSSSDIGSIGRRPTEVVDQNADARRLAAQTNASRRGPEEKRRFELDALFSDSADADRDGGGENHAEQDGEATRATRPGRRDYGTERSPERRVGVPCRHRRLDGRDLADRGAETGVCGNPHDRRARFGIRDSVERPRDLRRGLDGRRLSGVDRFRALARGGVLFVLIDRRAAAGGSQQRRSRNTREDQCRGQRANHYSRASRQNRIDPFRLIDGFGVVSVPTLCRW